MPRPTPLLAPVTSATRDLLEASFIARDSVRNGGWPATRYRAVSRCRRRDPTWQGVVAKTATRGPALIFRAVIVVAEPLLACDRVLARVFAAAVIGVDAVPVSVEVDVSSGLPGLTMVGLP